MRYACAIVFVVLLGGYAWGASRAAPTPPPEQDDLDTLPSPPSGGIAPLRAVLDYLRYYESQPARVLPYIT